MRWSWRANLLPITLDALLEGSLVGILYLALTLGPAGSSAPLSLFEFWVAAGAGLVVARWRPRRLARVNWVMALVLGAGLAGWLADPAARSAIASAKDPLAAVPVHPSGWLLSAAVLLGALHAKAANEREIASRALVVAFPVLALSFLIHPGSAGAFRAIAVAGSVISISAGLLAIGNARLRELEALGSVTRGARTWPIVAAAVVVVAALAIPLAVLIGASGRDWAAAVAGPLGSLVGSVVGVIVGLLDGVFRWLGSILQLILDMLFGRSPNKSLTASPTPSPRLVRPVSLPNPGWTLTIPDWAVIRIAVTAVLVVIAVLLLLRFRRFIPGREVAPPAVAVAEERRRMPHGPKLGLRLPRPALLARLQGLRRRPTSAAAAYVALLDDLEDLDDEGKLARRPSETPRDHAQRAAKLGLDRLPLGLLAADYELAVYGRAEITPAETKRAFGRWRRLRKLARKLPADEGWE